jgi:hypothetical protein
MYKVWRVENAEGLGPYLGPSLFSIELCEAHNADPDHPGPDVDFISLPSKSFKYGFLSKEHAIDWFIGWFDLLDKQGYRLVECDAKWILHSKSGKQVAFIAP